MLITRQIYEFDDLYAFNEIVSVILDSRFTIHLVKRSPEQVYLKWFIENDIYEISKMASKCMCVRVLGVLPLKYVNTNVR